VLAAACSEPRAQPDAVPCPDCAVRVHPPGILDPASPDFHPRELARLGWDLRVCAGCHGADFSGGAAGVSCLTCHPAGPTACDTCHGAGAMDAPAGNHAPHLAAHVACAACHVVPATWDAPGHILGASGPAQVVFGPLASTTPWGSTRAGPPSWDGATCRNVYCHGDVGPIRGGVDPEPRWDEQPPAFTCDRCHGAPPPDHPLRTDCVTCHPPSTAPTHVDGKVDFVDDHG
jgi:predicted CxxxxCH...CXXCH cytochrome family protein